MPFYLLIIFLIFEYLRPGLYFPPINILKINTIFPLMLTIYAAFKNDYLSNIDFLKLKSTRWLLFYLFLILISVFTSDVTYYAYDYFLQIFGYFLVFYVLNKMIQNISQLKLIFRMLIIIHLIIIVLNPQVILSPERSYLNHTFMGDGNDFAWSVCIIFPFSIYLYLESPKKTRVYYLLILLLLLFSIIMTSSRGATLALAAVIIYQWLKAKKKIVGVIILILTVFSVLLFAPALYFERMGTIADYEEEGSAQGRLLAWGSAIRMALDHPILGVGAGHFAVKYGVEYRPPGYGPTDLPWANAHSIYFKTLGEFGFTGIIFLLSIIISNFILTEKYQKYFKYSELETDKSNKRLLIAMNSSLIGYSIAGTFLSGINYPHLFVLVALVEVSRKIIDNDLLKLNAKI